MGAATAGEHSIESLECGQTKIMFNDIRQYVDFRDQMLHKGGQWGGFLGDPEPESSSGPAVSSSYYSGGRTDWQSIDHWKGNGGADWAPWKRHPIYGIEKYIW